MDVLSDVLKVVKLDGALFFNGEFSAPWCFHSRLTPDVARHLSPRAGHLIIFHFLTEGRAYARLTEDAKGSRSRRTVRSMAEKLDPILSRRNGWSECGRQAGPGEIV